MEIKLISYTPDPEKVVAIAAKTCYASEIPDGSAFDHPTMIRRLVSMGHESPFEHASFTFAVSGVSRVLTHQLVRHRLASYSQQSQRYVRMDEPEIYLPDMDATAREAMTDAAETVIRIYQLLIKYGVPEEDARYILPGCVTSNIVITMNARELMHFFSQRCCGRAQQEIRDLANGMLEEVKQVAPTIFEKAGPPCKRGACPEGPMSCGGIR